MGSSYLHSTCMIVPEVLKKTDIRTLGWIWEYIHVVLHELLLCELHDYCLVGSRAHISLGQDHRSFPGHFYNNISAHRPLLRFPSMHVMWSTPLGLAGHCSAWQYESQFLKKIPWPSYLFGYSWLAVYASDVGEQYRYFTLGVFCIYPTRLI